MILAAGKYMGRSMFFSQGACTRFLRPPFFPFGPERDGKMRKRLRLRIFYIIRGTVQVMAEDFGPFCIYSEEDALSSRFIRRPLFSTRISLAFCFCVKVRNKS